VQEQINLKLILLPALDNKAMRIVKSEVFTHDCGSWASLPYHPDENGQSEVFTLPRLEREWLPPRFRR